MNIENIRELAAIMKEFDLSSLELMEEGSPIKMERNPAFGAIRAAGDYSGAASVGIIGGADGPTAFYTTEMEPEKAPEAAQRAGTDVLSPTVGVFYSAPSPDSEPFVKVGSKVKKGDVLCIIEAMKLMNEITAETDGEISQVYIGNGQVVEYDQPLFRIV